MPQTLPNRVLSKHCCPNLDASTSDDGIEPTFIFPTKKDADRTNRVCFEKLKGQKHAYNSRDKGPVLPDEHGGGPPRGWDGDKVQVAQQTYCSLITRISSISYCITSISYCSLITSICSITSKLTVVSSLAFRYSGLTVWPTTFR